MLYQLLIAARAHLSLSAASLRRNGPKRFCWSSQRRRTRVAAFALLAVVASADSGNDGQIVPIVGITGRMTQREESEMDAVADLVVSKIEQHGTLCSFAAENCTIQLGFTWSCAIGGPQSESLLKCIRDERKRSSTVGVVYGARDLHSMSLLAHALYLPTVAYLAQFESKAGHSNPNPYVFRIAPSEEDLPLVTLHLISLLSTQVFTQGAAKVDIALLIGRNSPFLLDDFLASLPQVPGTKPNISEAAVIGAADDEACSPEIYIRLSSFREKLLRLVVGVGQDSDLRCFFCASFRTNRFPDIVAHRLLWFTMGAPFNSRWWQATTSTVLSTYDDGAQMICSPADISREAEYHFSIVPQIWAPSHKQWRCGSAVFGDVKELRDVADVFSDAALLADSLCALALAIGHVLTQRNADKIGTISFGTDLGRAIRNNSVVNFIGASGNHMAYGIETNRTTNVQQWVLLEANSTWGMMPNCNWVRQVGYLPVPDCKDFKVSFIGGLLGLPMPPTCAEYVCEEGSIKKNAASKNLTSDNCCQKMCVLFDCGQGFEVKNAASAILTFDNCCQATDIDDTEWYVKATILLLIVLIVFLCCNVLVLYRARMWRRRWQEDSDNKSADIFLQGIQRISECFLDMEDDIWRPLPPETPLNGSRSESELPCSAYEAVCVLCYLDHSCFRSSQSNDEEMGSPNIDSPGASFGLSVPSPLSKNKSPQEIPQDISNQSVEESIHTMIASRQASLVADAVSALCQRECLDTRRVRVAVASNAKLQGPARLDELSMESCLLDAAYPQSGRASIRRAYTSSTSEDLSGDDTSCCRCCARCCPRRKHGVVSMMSNKRSTTDHVGNLSSMALAVDRADYYLLVLSSEFTKNGIQYRLRPRLDHGRAFSSMCALALKSSAEQFCFDGLTLTPLLQSLDMAILNEVHEYNSDADHGNHLGGDLRNFWPNLMQNCEDLGSSTAGDFQLALLMLWSLAVSHGNAEFIEFFKNSVDSGSGDALFAGMSRVSNSYPASSKLLDRLVYSDAPLRFPVDPPSTTTSGDVNRATSWLQSASFRGRWPWPQQLHGLRDKGELHAQRRAKVQLARAVHCKFHIGSTLLFNDAFVAPAKHPRVRVLSEVLKFFDRQLEREAADAKPLTFNAGVQAPVSDPSTSLQLLRQAASHPSQSLRQAASHPSQSAQADPSQTECSTSSSLKVLNTADALYQYPALIDLPVPENLELSSADPLTYIDSSCGLSVSFFCNRVEKRQRSSFIRGAPAAVSRQTSTWSGLANFNCRCHCFRRRQRLKVVVPEVKVPDVGVVSVLGFGEYGSVMCGPSGDQCNRCLASRRYVEAVLALRALVPHGCAFFLAYLRGLQRNPTMQNMAKRTIEHELDIGYHHVYEAVLGLIREESAYSRLVSCVDKSIDVDAASSLLANPADATDLITKAVPRHRRLAEYCRDVSRLVGGDCVGGIGLERMPHVKSLWRILEKSCLEPTLYQHDGTFARPVSSALIRDVARNSILFECCQDMCKAIDIITSDASPVRICRGKNRFKAPSQGGWADVLLNVVWKDDPEEYVMEIQLIHTKLMMIRHSDAFAGHDSYGRLRAAAEVTEVLKHAGEEGQNFESSAIGDP